MWATCRRNSRAGGAARGFTLLEMLVVLAIGALLVAIVVPGLKRMLESVELGGQRKAIVTQLDGLGYRSYASGKRYVLAGTPAADDAAPLDWPAGWKLEVPRPIEYAFNGQCSGGRLVLVAPDGRRESFQLRAPLCRLEPEA